MLSLLRGEFFKLRHSRGFLVLMALSVVIGSIEFIANAYGGAFGDGLRMTGNDAFYSQFVGLRTLIFIFAGAFSGIFIGDDFACRTFQAEVATGNSRFNVLLSKTLVYMLGICMMILAYLVISTAGVSLVNGFGGTMAAARSMVRAGLMFMLHICACSMLCVLTSIILKIKGSILTVNFLMLVVIDGLFQLFSPLSNTVLQIYVATPFLQSLLSAAPTISPSDILKSVATGIVFISLVYSLTYRIFYRCELK